MNKLFTKIATLSVGLLMAIGVGVGIASGRDAVAARADDTTVTFTPSTSQWSTTGGAQSGTISGVTVATSSGAYNTSNGDFRVYKNAKLTVTSTVGTITSLEFSFSGSNNGGWSTSYSPNADSWESPAASGTQARITELVITVAGGGTSVTLSSLNITGSPSKTSYFDNETFDPTGITAYQAVYSDESTKDLSANDITWPALTAGMTKIKGSYTEDSTTVYTPEYSITVAANSVTFLAVVGSMTNTTYNQGDAWNPSGFTVNAYYASAPTTPVDVTSDTNLVWSYDPETTASTSTTSVIATASFGGQTASSDAQTVTINEKQNLGGLTEGRFFLIVGGHVLKASTFAAKGADTYTTADDSVDGLLESDAWYFAPAGADDTWTIRVSDANNADYLYATNANNGLVSGGTSDSWTVSEGTGNYAGKLVMQDTSRSRYISYTTSPSSYIRTYENLNNGNCEVAFIKYTEPDIAASIGGNDFVDSGSQWTTGGITEDVSGDTVTGAAYSFAAGQGVTITAQNATDGTFTATVSNAAGIVTVSATKDGYAIASKNVTVNPKVPYIIPTKNASSGYVGQGDTLSFTYGNLAFGLVISSGDESVVTVAEPSASVGSGTVAISFVGAGTANVLFKDGTTQLAEVSVSVQNSSVTITGLAETGDVYIGKTLNLGSTITVTPTGTYSSDVTWESEDDDIATVSDAGVVTGVAVGTVDITVTSDDYPSATMTCSVTVSEAPLEATYDFVTNFSSYNEGWGNSYGTHEGINGKTQLGGDYAATIDLYKASKQTGTITDRPVFATKTASGSWTKVIGFTLTELGYTIEGVEVSFSQWGSKTPSVALFAGDAASGTPLDTGTIGTKNAVSTDNLNGTTFTIGYSDGSGDNVQSGLTSITITLKKQNILESVAVSFSGDPADRTFEAGTNFEFKGTLTASYSVADSREVTPASFHLDSEDGETIDETTILTIGEHNGHNVFAVYSEGGITKSDSFGLIVNYAPVSSVVIDVHAAKIGLNETFDYTVVGVEVNSSYAPQGYEWVVSATTVGDDYLFDNSGLLSGDTEGTVTLRCRSTADNSKYDELVVTITGNPAASFTSASVSGYEGKNANVSFTYTNMDDTSKISVVSSDPSKATVGAITASNGNGSVVVNFVSNGSATLSLSYNGGATLTSITVNVSSDSVKTVTWTAPTIKVYSGATLSSTTGWNVHYEMNSGDQGDLTSGFNVKLDGETISLPHTWSAEEDGKALCVEYGGVCSATTTVDVTQTIRQVNADIESESSLVFTEACGGSGTAEDGKAWTITSDGTESSFDSQNGKGIHYGTGSASVQYIKLTSTEFSTGKITKVVVQASTASGVSATVSVTVGGVAFGGDAQSLTASNASYTFTGNADAGTIEVLITKPTSATKAIYCKGVAVTASSGSKPIANVEGHEAAQKAVVKFAKAFNEAMDTTSNCTENMENAWSAATSAWNTFVADISSLSEAEQAYAKDLLKYATAQYTPETDENYEYCVERAMATYERCVSKHGQTPFMSEIKSVPSHTTNNPLALLTQNNDSTLIIVIVSMVGVLALGGYFYLRKRKEQ